MFITSSYSYVAISHVDVHTGIDGSKECVYLYGNGLGLQPTGTKELVDEEIKKWKCK